jgi:large subunit ribosomal protein L35
MPKLKTHRGAAKRFSVTGTGKIKRSRANTSHILTPKTTKRKRNLRQSTILDASDEKQIRRLIPYLF